MRYKAPSIKETGGLKVWLDAKKAENNGLDYDVFVTMYTQKVNPTNIARSFGKQATTIKHWITVYKEEQQLETPALLNPEKDKENE